MPGVPRLAFSDEQQLVLGGKEVIAKYLGRGHTNGDAVILSPASGCCIPATSTFPAARPSATPPTAARSRNGKAPIQKALQLDFDTVIPGHGAVMKKADLEMGADDGDTSRTRIKTACAGGVETAGARMDWSGLNMTGGAMFDRGLPGMCKELAQ